MRSIEAIKSGTEGEIAAAAIRAAVRAIEASTPIGTVLATVSAEPFLPALIEAAGQRPPEEERAWLTLAAAGAAKVRPALAWRATDLLDPEAVVGVFLDSCESPGEACERLAEGAANDEERGAWMLLSWLEPGQLRRLVRGRPRLRFCLRERREERAGVEPRSAAPPQAWPSGKAADQPPDRRPEHALGLL